MKKKIIFLVMSLVFVTLAASELRAQTDWENPVKKTLREGKPVVGLTITVPSPDIVVQAASLGFDFVWIEMEHSPVTLETVRNMVQIGRAHV